MATVSLSQMPTLKTLYAESQFQPSTHLKANATSRYILGGGGVDGAIHRAAGPQLLDECEQLDGCDTGDAKITDAYQLPCKKVVHAVGPVYRYARREGMAESLLAGCYTKALDLATRNGCRSIAFSALSTGVYGYPSEEAAEVAIGAVKAWLEANKKRARGMDKIIFCSFMEKDQKAYEKSIP